MLRKGKWWYRPCRICGTPVRCSKRTPCITLGKPVRVVRRHRPYRHLLCPQCKKLSVHHPLKVIKRSSGCILKIYDNIDSRSVKALTSPEYYMTKAEYIKNRDNLRNEYLENRKKWQHKLELQHNKSYQKHKKNMRIYYQEHKDIVLAKLKIKREMKKNNQLNKVVVGISS